jgi:hypothetical protein
MSATQGELGEVGWITSNTDQGPLASFRGGSSLPEPEERRVGGSIARPSPRSPWHGLCFASSRCTLYAPLPELWLCDVNLYPRAIPSGRSSLLLCLLPSASRSFHHERGESGGFLASHSLSLSGSRSRHLDLDSDSRPLPHLRFI